MRTVLLPLLTLAVSVASGQTLGRPRALNLTWRALWQAQAPVRLPVVKDPARERLDLPPLPHADDAVVCVRFQARLHTERPAGWNNYLALVLNGTQVDHKTPEGWPRALNREPLFATTYPNWPQVQLVESRAGLPCLQVFFGPPEPDLKTTLPIEAEEGYWYVLNIDDLVRADAPNTLELVDTALAEYWGDRMPPGLAMIVSDLSVGCVSKTEVAKLQGDLFAPPQRWTGQPALKGPAATVRMTPAGGLQIETGDETWFIESGFSYPAEPAMAFNRLRCGPPGADEWDRRIAREGQALVLQAEAKPYRLRREVRWRNQRLEVADAITNLTDEVLGLAVEHSIITPQPPRVVRLGGLDEYARGAGTCPENPTVFAAQGKSGVGLVAEDDAMRLQMSTLAMVNQVRLRTDRLGLAPEETYTLRWAVYPGSTDYFDFINALRRDWDVNYTVEGPFDFFSVRQLDSEEGRAAAKALLARKHLKLFALVPWFEYYSGWPYTRDQYREMMTRAIAFIHEAVPGAKCLACTETNLVPVPLTFFGDTIPAEGWPIGRDKGGKYGQPATPAMTAKVDASPWRDSCIRDASGNVVLDCWYVQYYTEPPGLN
ncbi:MAG: hypothetical protein FJX75_24475, partial [Armatimonadetes bacterium]|nr:hypothetical protein [Armatimonadota bacterium]